MSQNIVPNTNLLILQNPATGKFYLAFCPIETPEMPYGIALYGEFAEKSEAMSYGERVGQYLAKCGVAPETDHAE